MAIKRGVSALVLNKKGEILLTLRQDLRDWRFPGGGIEKGESLQKAVKREIEEETGIKVKIKRLAAVYIIDHLLWKSVNFFFLATTVGGRFKKQKGETLDLRWVKKQDAHKFLPERHYQRLLAAFSDDKKIKVQVSHQFPIPVAKLLSFLWRRYLGKWLGLVEV